MTLAPARLAESFVRDLTPAERSELTARLTRVRVEARTALARTAMSAAIVCGLLALATIAASDAPWPVILLFWSLLCALLTLWIGLPWHRTMKQQVAWLADALNTGRARETRVQSSRVVEFEEEEDEGACFAFDHGAGASVFVVGQEFYEDDDFPNSDFAVVELLGSDGRAIDSWLVKSGRKLTPLRVIPAAVKNLLEIPDHLAVIDAPLDHIDDALRNEDARR